MGGWLAGAALAAALLGGDDERLEVLGEYHATSWLMPWLELTPEGAWYEPWRYCALGPRMTRHSMWSWEGPHVVLHDLDPVFGARFLPFRWDGATLLLGVELLDGFCNDLSAGLMALYDAPWRGVSFALGPEDWDWSVPRRGLPELPPELAARVLHHVAVGSAWVDGDFITCDLGGEHGLRAGSELYALDEANAAGYFSFGVVYAGRRSSVLEPRWMGYGLPDGELAVSTQSPWVARQLEALRQGTFVREERPDPYTVPVYEVSPTTPDDPQDLPGEYVAYDGTHLLVLRITGHGFELRRGQRNGSLVGRGRYERDGGRLVLHDHGGRFDGPKELEVRGAGDQLHLIEGEVEYAPLPPGELVAPPPEPDSFEVPADWPLDPRGFYVRRLGYRVLTVRHDTFTLHPRDPMGHFPELSLVRSWLWEDGWIVPAAGGEEWQRGWVEAVMPLKWGDAVVLVPEGKLGDLSDGFGLWLPPGGWPTDGWFLPEPWLGSEMPRVLPELPSELWRHVLPRAVVGTARWVGGSVLCDVGSAQGIAPGTRLYAGFDHPGARAFRVVFAGRTSSLLEPAEAGATTAGAFGVSTQSLLVPGVFEAVGLGP